MTLTKPTIGQLGGPSGWPSLINTAFDNIDANTAGLAAKVAKGDLVLNIKDYGAVGDGTANDTTAITNAIAAAVAGGGAVYVPPGTFKVTSAIVVTTRVHMFGAGRLWSVIQSSTSDVLNVSQAHVHIEGISFKSLSGGGHVVVVPPSATAGTALAQSRFVGCEFNQSNSGSNVWRHYDPTGLGGGFFDVHWLDCWFQHTTSATVPGFYGYSTAGNFFSRNRFTRCRAHSSGVYFFDIQLDLGSTYNYGNVWDTINFEVCDGGGIRILSGMANQILSPGFHDNGTITADLIYFGRLATRNQSLGNVVSGYYRTTGTLSGGAVDIHLGSGENTGTTWIAAPTGPTAAGVTLDLGSGGGFANVTAYDPTRVTVNNAAAATTVLSTSGLGISAPVFTMTDTTKALSVPLGLAFGGTDPATVPSIRWATGDPETVTTAVLGSIRMRTNTNGALPLWVKETGTGNATGWVAAQVIKTATTAQLAAIGNAINTAGKIIGREVFNTTTNKPVWASGTATSSVWVDATGATAHTPV